MKIKFLELDIRVSELQTQRVSVAAWEYPVLQAIWGSNVQVVNEVLIDRKAPEAADEFHRLAVRYGSPEIEGTPYVAAVYGQFGPGVAALQRAIEAAVYEGSVVTSERPAASVPTADVIPASVSRPIEEIRAELAAAEALAAKKYDEQKGQLATPLTVEQVETVKAASPEIAEKIEKLEAQSDVKVGFAELSPDADDALAGLI